MAVVAQSGTDCHDQLRQDIHSQTHSGVDRWLNFFMNGATLINFLHDNAAISENQWGKDQGTLAISPVP
jgi:hypothetical protein